MDKVAKMLLNAMRCPLCKSQIDIANFKTNRSFDSWHSNFGCVKDPEHYGIWFMYEEGPPHVEREMVVINEGFHQYRVIQSDELITVKAPTTIKICDIDAE